MSPSRTEKPVASTPNTPDARSPSSNTLPSGARRRTSSIAPTAALVTPTTIPPDQNTPTARPQRGVRTGAGPGRPAAGGAGPSPPSAAGAASGRNRAASAIDTRYATTAPTMMSGVSARLDFTVRRLASTTADSGRRRTATTAAP